MSTPEPPWHSRLMAWTGDEMEFADEPQAVSLAGGWHDAWRHELRGPGGEWVSGSGMAETVAGKMRPSAQDAELGQAAAKAAEQMAPLASAGMEVAALRNAAKAFNAGDTQFGVNSLRVAAAEARKDTKSGTGEWRAKSYDAMADRATPPDVSSSTPGAQAVTKVIASTRDDVASYFGGQSVIAWDGKPPGEFKQAEHKHVLGDINWTGHMEVSDAVSQAVHDALTDPNGEVSDPDLLITPLHEMIHSAVARDSYTPGLKRQEDADAYLDTATQQAEEGWTQLGATVHAPEWMTTAGFGDRVTPFYGQYDELDTPAKNAVSAKMETDLRTLRDSLLKDGRPPQGQAAQAIGTVLDGYTSVTSRKPNVGDWYDQDVIAAINAVRNLGDPSTRDQPGKLLGDLDAVRAAQHLTVAEYAQRQASPMRIKQQDSWPNYPDWAAHGYEIAERLAELGNGGKADPALTARVIDSVNAVGASQKFRRMAEVALSAAVRAGQAKEPQTPGQRELALAAAEKAIYSSYTGPAWKIPKNAVDAITRAQAGYVTPLAGIAAQALELGWSTAWRTELRGRHGQWIRSSNPIDVAKHAGLRVSNPFQHSAADPVEAASIAHFMRTADQIVPRLVGSSSPLDWDHKTPTVYPDARHPGYLAFIDWHGHVNFSETAAGALHHAVSGTGPIEHPDALLTPLHEFIHAVVPEGEARDKNGDEKAYQDPAHQAIEEGFTELGATSHAEAFFRGLGIGDRATGSKAADGRTFSMAEYARDMANPARIQAGTSWGHYADWTSDAYGWVAEISRRSGGAKTPAELSDEISRVGTAAKPHVMAQQLLEASGLANLTYEETVQALGSAQEQILASWQKNAAADVASQAMATMRGAVAAMRGERAAA